MKLFQPLLVALATVSLSSALSIPSDVTALSIRDVPSSYLSTPLESINELFKRKGGGGKGGGGGTSSGGSRPSSGGGSSSSSGSRTGGTTGVQPSFSGGRFYGGGATTAYRAGGKSPRGINPLLLGGVGAAAIFPGLWLAGAYAYPYNHHYTFHNSSATNSSNPSGVNQTKEVECLCAKDADCGCDDNGDDSYIASVVGNGSYAGLNKTLVNAVNVNGTDKIVLNGTLPSGTATTSGAVHTAVEWSGYWVMVATVMYAVWGL